MTHFCVPALPQTTKKAVHRIRSAREEQADLVMLAHKELGDPHFPYHAAKALGIADPQNVLPPQ